jgi:hypothetical protein
MPNPYGRGGRSRSGSPAANNIAGATLSSVLSANSAACNNSETLIDSGITLTLVTGGVYWVHGIFPYTTAAAADIKLQMTNVGGTYAGTLWDDKFYEKWTIGTPKAITGGAVTDYPQSGIDGILTVTVGGILKLQFAQNTADVSNTTISSGAFMIAVRLA